MFFPLESFDFKGTQSAIQCIKENIHFFCLVFICNEFCLILCEQQTTKEGLETRNIDLTSIPYCEFQREVFARDWLLLGLFQLIVLRTLQPGSAKRLAGGLGVEIISCRKFFFHSNREKQHPGFHSGLILWSTKRISAFVDRLIQSLA